MKIFDVSQTIVCSWMLMVVAGGSGASDASSVRLPPSHPSTTEQLQNAASSTKVDTMDSVGANSRPIPPDFSLEISTGGGFAGTIQGHRVTADGAVVAWKTAPHGGTRSTEPLGILEKTGVVRLVQVLTSERFFALVLDQPGNMTVQISGTMSGRSHTVRYPLPMDQHPESVRKVVESFRAELRSLEGSRMKTPSTP